jgi:hypothetical protein
MPLILCPWYPLLEDTFASSGDRIAVAEHGYEWFLEPGEHFPGFAICL